MSLDCSDVQELFPLYKSNEIGPGLKKMVDQHLEKCEDCSRIYQEEKSFVDVLGKLEDKQPSAIKEQDLLRQFRLRRLLLFLVPLLTVAIIISVFGRLSAQRSYVVEDLHHQHRHAVNLMETLSYAIQGESIRGHNYQLAEVHYSYLERNLTYNERFPYFLIGEMTGLDIFVGLIQARASINRLTARDQQAATMMQEYFQDYADILLNIKEDFANRRTIFSKALVQVDAEALAQIVQHISRLAWVYTEHDILPQEQPDKDMLMALIGNQLGIHPDYVYLDYFDSPGTRIPGAFIANTGYTFQVVDDAKNLLYEGTVNPWNGGIGRLTLADEFQVILKGKTPTEVADEIIYHWLGHLGLEYEYEFFYRRALNLDPGTPADTIQVTRFSAIPVVEGVRADRELAITVEMRGWKPGSLSAQVSEISFPAINLAELATYQPTILIEPAIGLEQLEDQWEYLDTVIIRSLYTGDWITAYKFGKGDTQEYINAETGAPERKARTPGTPSL